MPIAIFYIILSVAVMIATIIIGYLSYEKGGKLGRSLSFTCFSAVLVVLTYLVSVIAKDELIVSIFSSIYFIGIDILLVSLLMFICHMTKFSKYRGNRILINCLVVYGIIECVFFIVNIFNNFSISYVFTPNMQLAHYQYDMHPVYYLHLVYTYSMVISSILFLSIKYFQVPREYRLQYLIIIISILVIVLINGIFLFVKLDPETSNVDSSTFVYIIALAMSYYSCFNYSKHRMLNKFKSTIFENIDQGILLFDYNDEVILYNSKAESFLSHIESKSNLSLKTFLVQATSTLSNKDSKSYALQLYLKNGNETVPIRCDYRLLKNKRNEVLGKIFVIVNATLDTDILTSFHNWENFKRLIDTDSNKFYAPSTIGVLDINKLSLYNDVYGKQGGDQLIKKIADRMKELFPEGSYFIRGHSAAFIVICYNKAPEFVKEIFKKIENEFDNITLQYSTAYYNDSSLGVYNSILEAFDALKARKLLDKESSNSAVISSLIRTLKECDPDLEGHVARTRALGNELGIRLGLTDADLSYLSLLCLLHDIGKIGIPIEVLNKPGKLTDEEFEIIKSHVEKGYNIAMSTPELNKIADMILYHHERWDGKGYPSGLYGDSIPLLSRIISLVDAFDAMVSVRTYKEGYPINEVLEEIRKCSGSQFDPHIANEFIHMIEEKYGDTIIVKPQEEKKDQKPIVVDDQVEEIDNDRISYVNHSIYTLNERNEIISIDENFTALTGYTKKDIESKIMHQADLIPEEDRVDYICMINSLTSKNHIVFFEHPLLKKDGTKIYVLCIGRQYYETVSKKPHSEIIIANSLSTYSSKIMAKNIESRVNTRVKQWEKTYRQDELTGLLNRNSFRADIDNTLLDGKKKVILIMIDIDHFKDYNDSFGHHEGDKCLVLVGNIMTSFIKKNDLACRMGGDEFSVAIITDDYNEEELRKFTSNYFSNVNMSLKAHKNAPSVSMGIAVSQDKDSFTALYKRADKALYHSKDSGRERYTFYSDIEDK